MAEKTYAERLKPSGNSFKDAFASAKKAGKKEFTWKGRDYTTVTKEEILKCKDGYDGPNYWELFAQFYYTGLTAEPYCRWVARPDHPFKTPREVCLNEKGVWEN